MVSKQAAAVLFSFILVNTPLRAQNTLYVDDRGNIGVGTDQPQSKFDVLGNASVTGEVRVTGDIKVTGNVTGSGDLSANRVRDKYGYLDQVPPPGGIIMYYGDLNNFGADGKGKKGTPFEGWARCDGRNCTPDLRDKFVLGSNEHNYKQPGGSATVTLGIKNMPSHSHAILHTNNGREGDLGHPAFGRTNVVLSDHGRSVASEYIQKTEGRSTSERNKDVTPIDFIQPTGGGEAFSIMPPYIALMFIMKLPDGCR